MQNPKWVSTIMHETELGIQDAMQCKEVKIMDIMQMRNLSSENQFQRIEKPQLNRPRLPLH